MSQSTIIAGCLFLAFLAYITNKGELPTYMSFFGIGSSGSSGVGAAVTGAVTGAVGGLGNMTSNPAGTGNGPIAGTGGPGGSATSGDLISMPSMGLGL